MCGNYFSSYDHEPKILNSWLSAQRSRESTITVAWATSLDEMEYNATPGGHSNDIMAIPYNESIMTNFLIVNILKIGLKSLICEVSEVAQRNEIYTIFKHYIENTVFKDFETVYNAATDKKKGFCVRLM